MKYAKHFLFVAIMLLHSVALFSATTTGTCGNNLTWRLTSSYELIIEGSGAMTDYETGSDSPWFGNYMIRKVTIRSGVTSIGANAFFCCQGITSVTIPSSVKEIGKNAFNACTGLTSMVIPEGVTRIAWGAFFNCTNLATVTFPESLTEIDDQAFTNLKWFENQPDGAVYAGKVLYAYKGKMPANALIEVKEGTVSISPSAFQSNNNLISITLPESIVSLGRYSFMGCDNLASITCRAIVPPVCGNGAVFSGVSLSTPVYVPAVSVTAYRQSDVWKGFSEILPVIASGTYRDNMTWRLTEDGDLIIEGIGEMQSDDNYPWSAYKTSVKKITIKDGVTSIGDKAFAYHGNLVSVDLPKSLLKIGASAFTVCSSLSSITIPECVTEIGDWALWECTGLASISLPKNLQVIGDCAIACCLNLEKLYCYAESIPSVSMANFSESNNDNAVLYVPESVIEYYRNTAPWNSFRNISCLTAGDGGMADSQTVEVAGIWYNLIKSRGQAEVTFAADGSKYIGNVTIPSVVVYDGVEYRVVSIGEGAFADCAELASIAFPEDSVLSSIKERAFYGCSNLVQIVLPEGVESIGDMAFADCMALEKVELPQGLKNLGDLLFAHCFNFSTIAIPASVETIGRGAFCERIDPINIHVESIAWWCNVDVEEDYIGSPYNIYINNELVKDLVIPGGVSEIKNSRFEYCDSLTSVTIYDGCTSIGYHAFYYCANLLSVKFPRSLQYIDQYAFCNCAQLKDVYCYADNILSVHESAFEQSNIGSATLHVPASLIADYWNTVPWNRFYEIVPLDGIVTGIVLSQSSVTIVEGATLTLTPTVYPEDAVDQSVIWYSTNTAVATVDVDGVVTAVAPGRAAIVAVANDGCGMTASCEVTVNEAVLGKCATPVVRYVNGRILLTSETKGVDFVTEVVAENAQASYREADFELTAAYVITAYATKDKYENSERVTVTLCWVACNGVHEDHNGEGVVPIPSVPVVIQCSNGVISLTGLSEGTDVAVYDLSGRRLGGATAVNGAADIRTNLSVGSVVIINIAGRSIKVRL